MTNRSETHQTHVFDIVAGKNAYECNITHPDGHVSKAVAFSKQEAERLAAEKAAQYDRR